MILELLQLRFPRVPHGPVLSKQSTELRPLFLLFGHVEMSEISRRSVVEAGVGVEGGRTRNTHKVQGLLAAIHIGKYFFQLMTFQALSMLESAHDILLERVFQLVFLCIGPPPTVLEEEPITRNRVINTLTIFDLLPLTVGKRVVRCRVVTNPVDRSQTKISKVPRREGMKEDCTDMS